MNNKKNIVLYLGLAISLTASANSNVNTTKLESKLDTTRVIDIDEVLVVSQPKENFRLRKQPLSTSFFGSQDLNALNIRDLRELSYYVPSFSMPNYGSRYTSSMYTRGIGSRVNNPAMGIYVDGMPLMSKSAFTHHIYGTQRVDILKGPQGTLYGQNAEGGLMRIHTLNPMNYQGTDVRLGWGTHAFRTAEMAHYNKVNSRVAFSVAGFYEGQDGFFRNENTGTHADKYNEAGGRFRLVTKPTKYWTTDFIANYQYTRQNAQPYGVLDAVTGLALPTSTTFQSNYKRNIFNTSLNLSYEKKGLAFSSISSYQYMRDDLSQDADFLKEDLVRVNQHQLHNAFTQELVLKGNVNNVWHSTTGAFMALQWLKTTAPVLFGNDFTNRISAAVSKQMYDAMLNGMVAKMMQGGMPEAAAKAQAIQQINAMGGVVMNMKMFSPGVYRTPEVNIGFYHESNLNITKRLIATLGLRYDYHNADIHYLQEGYVVSTGGTGRRVVTTTLSSVYDGGASNKFEQLLPKFGFTYMLGNKGSNVYALTSKGYRAGGYNIQTFADVVRLNLNANTQKASRQDYNIPHSLEEYNKLNEAITYKPETSWNYEVGAHINLLNQKLLIDFAAYYMDIKNQQLSVMVPELGFGRKIVNAGKTESYGLETTLKGLAVNNRLSWMLSYGYTHATFKAYTDKVVGAHGATKDVDYKGNFVPYIPTHTLAAMVDYRFDLKNCVAQSFSIGFNGFAQGKTQWNAANSYAQKLYANVGAHANVDFKVATLSFWARNIANTKYNVFAFDNASAGHTTYFGQLGNPFQCGVDLRLHF